MCELKSHRWYGCYIRELNNGQLRIDRANVKADSKPKLDSFCTKRFNRKQVSDHHEEA